jgi:uncharacterized protein (TIGR04255 family)
VSEEFTAASLADQADLLSSRLELPVRQIRKVRETKIDLGDAGAVLNVDSVSDLVERVVFTSEDGTRVVQLWSDGITASHLAPYGGWESLEQLAERSLSEWSAIAGATDTKRLAARFINRIEFEGARVDLDDLFSCAPQVPKGVPDDLFFFTSRIGIHDKSKGINAWILLEAAPQLTRGSTSVIVLDIDVIKEKSFGTVSFGELRGHLSDIRELKNSAFFGTLTDAKIKEYL